MSSKLRIKDHDVEQLSYSPKSQKDNQNAFIAL